MPGLFHILRCLARAVVKNGARALLRLVPFAEFALDIAQDTHAEFAKESDENDLRAALQELSQAPSREIHQAAQQVAIQEAAGQPEEFRLNLVSYLDQLPASIRQTLRRPSDPSGTTVPPSRSLKKPEDLVPFLPTGLPRFKPGDRPLAADWELVELLGKGGFGEVWKARQLTRSSQKPVALKFCLEPVAAQSLRNEASLHDLLDRVRQQGGAHGIVPLLETYLLTDPPCLMYEYIEGGDLAGLIQEWHPQGKLKPWAASQVVQRLAFIVGQAHRLNPPLVHRDLKPANILVRREADKKVSLFVADFGIGGLAAQLVLQEQVNQRPAYGQRLPTALRGAYTPLYASEQQVRGERPDPRDDVHALGVIWYQLVTGNLKMLSFPSDWREVVEEKGLSEEFRLLLGACVAQGAEKRPANAAVLAEKLAKLNLAEQQRRQAELDRPRLEEQRQREERQREEMAHKAAEEERQRRQRAEEAEKQRIQEEAKRKAAEEERQRRQRAEEAEKERIQEEAKRKAAEEERQRRQRAEEAEKQRIQEEAKRKAAEEERQRRQRAEEAEKQRLQEEAKRLAEELRRREQEEAQRRPIVCAGGQGTHSTISDALRTAPSGAEIRIRPGLYRENLVLNSPVSLLGDGPVGEIIIESEAASCIVVTAPGVIVRGLILQCVVGRGGGSFPGVEILRGNPLVEDCAITSDSSTCVVIQGKESNPTIRGCKIHDGAGSGVVISEQGMGTIEGCDIFSNRGAGIEIVDCCDPIIRNCNIHDQTIHAGVFVWGQGKGKIEGCDIFCNKLSGVTIQEGGDPAINNCKIHDNKESGVFVWENGKGTLKGCDIFANKLPGVMIQESGAPTICNCKIHDQPEHCGVFVFEQGLGTIEDCDIFANKLAGVTIQEGSAPAFRNCKIHDSKESGGVLVYEQGMGTIEGCDIFANKLAGIEIKQGSAPAFRNCKIHDSKESAGVLVYEQGMGTIEGCDIFANKFAGIEIKQGSNPTIRNCKIHHGEAMGLYVHEKGQGAFERCNIFANKGSAIEIGKAGNPTFRDCNSEDDLGIGVLVRQERAASSRRKQEEQLPAKQEHQGGKVKVTVPGEWFARPENEPEGEWRLVDSTPGWVSLLPGEVFKLKVALESVP